MPVDQVRARNRRYRRILGHAGVRTVCAISKFRGFPSGDLRGIVIAPRDAVIHPLLRNFNLVGAELRIFQHVLKYAKDVVKIFLQTRPAYSCGVATTAGVSFRGALLHIIIKLIARLSLGSTGAPPFAVGIGQPRFVRWDRALATANAGRSVDGWQLVVFL